MVSSLPLLSCELSVSVNENPDREKKKKKNLINITLIKAFNFFATFFNY